MQTLRLKSTAPGRIAVCQVWDISTGLGRGFQVAGRLVAVFKARDGQLFAVDGTCPHKGGPLADGMVVGHQVVCPLHAFRFASDSGACDQPGVCPIGTYRVEVDGDTVFVAVPA